jgi:ribosomal protein S18 acetylase RimI-like enzyme
MKITETRVYSDKSDTKNIVNTYMDQGHHKWFDSGNVDYMEKENLEYVLRNSLYFLSTHLKYEMKRVVIKDKGKVVGFLVWSDNSNPKIDDIGDNKKYSILLATAIHPDYRGKGLLRRMINKSGIQKPYLVHTSRITPKGLWEKMGCKIVKNLPNDNFVQKCD